MEELAREYGKALKTHGMPFAHADELIEIVEKQLDIITVALACGRQTNSALTYLESLKRLTLVDLCNLRGSGIAHPSCCQKRNGNYPRGKDLLIDLQISLLTALDTMKAHNQTTNVDIILAREERATAVIGLI